MCDRSHVWEMRNPLSTSRLSSPPPFSQTGGQMKNSACVSLGIQEIMAQYSVRVSYLRHDWEKNKFCISKEACHGGSLDLEKEVRTLKGTYCTVVNCLVNLFL